MDLSFEKRTAAAAGRGRSPRRCRVSRRRLAARRREGRGFCAASLSNRSESERNGEGRDGELGGWMGKGFPKGSFKRIVPSYMHMHVHIGGEERQAIRAHGK